MRIFVGAYDRLGGKGLGEVFLKPDGRHFEKINWDGSAPDPSYLAVNRAGTQLYAACEANESQVAAWDISGGGMRFLGARPVDGKAVCHVCLSPDERYLYAAGYTSGTVHVFPVETDGIGPTVQTVRLTGKGEDPRRQEGPHAHCVMFAPDGKRLCLCDLGQDAVILYRQDTETGLLTEASRACFSGGLGARHIAFSGNLAFVVHEMGNALSRLRYQNGELKWEKTWPVLGPEWKDKSTCAAVRVWDGRVYASNRGKDTVCAFDAEGNALGEWASGGQCPRDFLMLDGKSMLCANQESGNLVLIDPESGKTLDVMDAPGAVGLVKTEDE